MLDAVVVVGGVLQPPQAAAEDDAAVHRLGQLLDRAPRTPGRGASEPHIHREAVLGARAGGFGLPEHLHLIGVTAGVAHQRGIPQLEPRALVDAVLGSCGESDGAPPDAEGRAIGGLEGSGGQFQGGGAAGELGESEAHGVPIHQGAGQSVAGPIDQQVGGLQRGPIERGIEIHIHLEPSLGGVQPGIEADVAAVEGGLVDFPCQHVATHLKQARGQAGDGHRGLHRRALIGPSHGGRSQSVEGGVGSEVVAQHLLSVDVDRHPVVPNHRKIELLQSAQIGEGELPTEIGGDEERSTGAAGHHGGLVTVAIAQLSGPRGPGAGIEGEVAPERALVAAIGLVVPGGAKGKQGLAGGHPNQLAAGDLKTGGGLDGLAEG